MRGEAAPRGRLASDNFTWNRKEYVHGRAKRLLMFAPERVAVSSADLSLLKLPDLISGAKTARAIELQVTALLAATIAGLVLIP